MLSKPSITKIIVLHFLTFGLYFFYWCAHSRADIHRSARQFLIPSTWLLLLPGGNVYWMWQYAAALERVSYRRIKSSETFLLYLLAIFIWGILYQALPLPTFTNTSPSHSSVSALLLVLVALLLGQIVGLAAFCAVMQKKIDAITAYPPASPYA